MKQSFALERQYESESLDLMTDAPLQVFHSQRVKLIVGSDGVCVDGAGLRSVVSFRAISNVEFSEGNLLTIEHARGFEFFRGVDTKGKLAADLVQEALQALRLRRERFRAASGQPAIAALVTTGTANERIARLRALGVSPVETYRHMSIARDELWLLIENPTASLSERVAAIVVLRVRPLEDLIARVEAMADDLVDDGVSRSLRIAAAGNDRQLETLFAEEERIGAAPLSLPERLRRRKAF